MLTHMFLVIWMSSCPLNSLNSWPMLMLATWEIEFEIQTQQEVFTFSFFLRIVLRAVVMSSLLFLPLLLWLG